MFYFKKIPWLVKRLYNDRTWNFPTDEKILYLTFDDGPNPGATEFVLDQLKTYEAKATFFCVGKNVTENFALYERMISEGHKPGNHTYNHLNGWKTEDKIYIEDIFKAAKIIDTDLFRPPYGRISKFQVKAIRGEKAHLTTIMWDVLSGDFDSSVTGENCYLNVVNNAKPGSVIVFHDSMKSFTTLEYALPRVLKYYAEKEYQFKIIPSVNP